MLFIQFLPVVTFCRTRVQEGVIPGSDIETVKIQTFASPSCCPFIAIPPPRSSGTTTLFSISIILSFQEQYLNWIIWYVIFGTWLFHFRDLSGDTSRLLYLVHSFSFLSSYSTVGITITPEGLLGCLQFLAMKNKATCDTVICNKKYVFSLHTLFLTQSS